ncbi:MAG: hypothetical protein WBF04_20260 [Candidatus Sulfotelmatobacter sp.]
MSKNVAVRIVNEAVVTEDDKTMLQPLVADIVEACEDWGSGWELVEITLRKMPYD